MRDEQRTIERARRGDDRAWRVLYESHGDLVFRLALRTLGDRAAALDVVQDTFVKAAGALDGFRGDSSFRSWIARIAINEATSVARRRTRRRERPLEAIPEAADPAAGAEERAVRRDLAARALSLASSLPERQREVLLLRIVEGLSYAEIAAATGTSEGSARVSYHHAIQKLRERLERLSA